MFGNDEGGWAIGQPGDVITLGDWDCDGVATLALLRTSTGAVYSFNTWATFDRDLVADPLGTVAGARALEARDVDGDGCEEVVVHAADDELTTLRPPDRL